MAPDVVIVGAGVAGLACAVALAEAGATVSVLEASDAAGGRVRTDRVDGFLLDRGFQILPSAYPEAQLQLDYRALDLRAFYPGALVRFGGRFERLADPFARPLDALRSVRSPIGSIGDKLHLLALRRHVRAGSIEEIFQRPQMTTAVRLRTAGLSTAMIERFFRPFLSGVFLERELETASDSFEFVWRMFSAGEAVVPAHGMEEIPRQLAARLPAGSLRTGARATAVDSGSATLESGERIEAGAVVLAVDGAAAAALTDEIERPATRDAHCLYFAADRSPLSEPILVLNGEGRGPITTLCVPSDVAPAYAPGGSALVSVSVVGAGGGDLTGAVSEQLVEWYGEPARAWRHLRSYRIPEALPARLPGAPAPSTQPARLASGLFVCGDYREHPSLNGALASGRRTAAAVLAG